MNERTRVVSWRMPEDLYNQVVRIGVAEGRNVSGCLQMLTKLGIKEHRAGKIEERKHVG